MRTAEEKAKELVEKFNSHAHKSDYYHAKQCALIAVEEILSLKMIYNMGNDYGISEGEFYEQVKTKIEKL